MKNILQNKIKSVPKKVWILLGIIILGIFLRTYNFHDWLQMKSDQIRDAILVRDVITGRTPWPLLGPTVDGTGADKLYNLGPIYYYFQIISAKIFGDYPDKLAYPDLLFSILSIPLMYFFLKRYFSENLSLALTGLYSISFFAIQYSRFAWNPNSIPFFALLLLLTLHEFLIKKEKTTWFWIVMMGFALGVGVQLHGITLALFASISFLVFVFLIKKNAKIWKKIAIVIFIALVLNTGQWLSEIKTNFSNSKILLNYIFKSGSQVNKKNNFLNSIEKGIDCQVEVNAYMMSSLGSDSCSLNFIKLVDDEKSKSFRADIKNPFFLAGLAASFFFSLLGYIFLFYNCKNEKDKEKRYFLRLVALYLAISFLILLAGGHFSFRYFICAFFAPLLFLGFFINYLFNKFHRIHKELIILLLLLAGIANIMSLGRAAGELSEKGKTGYNADFMVQIEPLASYLIANADGQKKVYLDGDFAIMHISFPLKYFLERQRVELIKIPQDSHNYPDGVSVFYLSNKAPKDIDYEKIGQIYVFKIKN